MEIKNPLAKISIMMTFFQSGYHPHVVLRLHFSDNYKFQLSCNVSEFFTLRWTRSVFFSSGCISLCVGMVNRERDIYACVCCEIIS